MDAPILLLFKVVFAQADYMVLKITLLKFTGKGAKCVPYLSLNFIPAGAFLLWAIQKSFTGGNIARAESLSVKECKI